MHREPDMGFDPRSPGSRPEPKAGAKPLRHPGIPVCWFSFLPRCLFIRPLDKHLMKQDFLPGAVNSYVLPSRSSCTEEENSSAKKVVSATEERFRCIFFFFLRDKVLRAFGRVEQSLLPGVDLGIITGRCGIWTTL